MIYQLMYRSLSAHSMDWKMLSEIIQESQEKNRSAGITGLLIWTNKAFLQVMEGPRVAVSNCFQRIAKDERHQQVELMTLQAVATRLFPDWRMRGLNYMNLDKPYQELLTTKYGSQAGALAIPDDEQLALALLLDALYLSRSLSQLSQGNHDALTPGESI